MKEGKHYENERASFRRQSLFETICKICRKFLKITNLIVAILFEFFQLTL